MTSQAEIQLDGEPMTVQDHWLDAIVRHQVGLIIVAGGLLRRLFRTLDETETSVRRAIRDTLRHHAGGQGIRDAQRVAKLQDEIRTIRIRAWREVRTEWFRTHFSVATAEPRFTDMMLRSVLTDAPTTTLPAAADVRRIVGRKPFNGRTVQEWFRSLSETDVRRIFDQINIGIAQGDNPGAVARRVVGTQTAKGRDGVTQTTRNNLEAIVRSGVTHAANQGRQQYVGRNGGLFTEELYVAVLDGRTTKICRALDGRKFPPGVGPIPPLHEHCRSTRLPLIKGERQPMKVTYEEWLRRQPREAQDDILGPNRAKLFRSGGLELGNFVNPAGKTITLDQLAERHANAFRSAGLDPAKFTR